METMEAVFIFFCIAGFVAVYYSLPYHKYDKCGQLIIPESDVNLVHYDYDELEKIKKYWQSRAYELRDTARAYCLEEVERVEKEMNKRKIKNHA